mmetsp:Transcript_2949/g.6460  ORF Transcript_2949/g.6460 Transcript_2949/m.6460 type:complete len:839 (-) Transcript_2949:341-2857(-)
MANEEDNKDSPLNCIDDTGDGFSGWFAISNPRRCNDFCFWDLPDSNASYAAWNTADPHRVTVLETPEGINKAHWTCVYDSASDKVKVSQAKGERWIDSWEKYSNNHPELAVNKENGNAPFPYLRCQKGAAEKLKTWSGEVVRSASFWESWIVLASLMYVGEMVAAFLFYKRGALLKKLRYVRLGSRSFNEADDNEQQGEVGDNEGDMVDDGDDNVSLTSFQIDHSDGDGMRRDDEMATNGNENPTDFQAESPSFLTRFSFVRLGSKSSNHIATPRCKYCAPFASYLTKDSQKTIYILRILLIVLLNLLLAFTITFSAISLMEIHSNPHFKEGMERLTPQCSNPSLVCPAGNNDINRQSAPWPPPLTDHGRNDATNTPSKTIQGKNTPLFPHPKKQSHAITASIMEPFSYIIASDAQLYWFNGEFADMGKKSIPPACAPSDSCGRCTGKHGLATNARLKLGWENLMMEVNNNTTKEEDGLPVPTTLVMNGDLTAYFHPYQEYAYESIYNNIKGLKNYWPSLGNHDIEHYGGGMFGGDEWIGLPNCNVEHAIGYFKSGFCGQIPAFDAGRVVRYDSSSLAYSWDEGRYHFVHCHYYPTYEMASMNYHSSLEWLERDLQMAHDAGLATVLFVHAAQGLNDAMEDIILGKGVKVIIAGHTHRCLHRRCEGVYPLKEKQVENLDSLNITAAKCIPAAWDTCEVLNGENLIYVEDMEEEVKIPEKKLHNRKDKPDKPLCPQPDPFWINETDNTLLCRRVLYSHPNFPFGRENSSEETIPIFWSGSSSFETFLQGDFYEDKIVINAMTVVSEEGEVARYVDVNPVPNAVYPYHEIPDMEEFVIHI